MVSAALQNGIEVAVRSILAPITVSGVDIQETKNAFDDDALSVTVHLPDGVGALGGDIFVAMLAAVSDAVIDQGDKRFPSVRTLRVEDEVSDESVEAHK